MNEVIQNPTEITELQEQIRILEKQLEEKQEVLEYLQKMNEVIREREEKADREAQDAIAKLKKELEDKKGHVEQLLEVEREYEREKGSRSYKLVLKIRKFTTFLLPPNSKRRFVAAILKKCLRNPKFMLHVINPRRVINFFKVFKKEGMNGVLYHYQLVEAYEKAKIETFSTENLSIEEVSEEPKDISEYGVLGLPEEECPLVSIVIPAYNQFNYTYLCVKSIIEKSGDAKYEVILADDNSTDNTIHICEVIKGIRVVRNQQNLRFLKNCNNAAQYAKGEYILFLNNDTQVQENWLQPLITLMERDETIGMVGSKLVYADGGLQEAGGIIWQNGTGWNYGNRQNPNASEFNYVHEVDYISGASIMIRRKLWEEIGGFDELFAPAYCEDSDLAFEVRKHGYKVVYQPQSVVVHFEGISNGTDLSSGQKQYQVENAKKLYEKWKDVLIRENCISERESFIARDRSKNKRHILVIDHYVPQYDRDAGSKTTFMYLKMLVNKGFQITFLGDNFFQHEPYTTELQQMGICVLYGPWYANNWKEWLQENAQYFDVFYLNRPHISVKYIDFIKKVSEGKVIYYGHDLHFLRTKREYELSGDKKKLEESKDWLMKEMDLMHKADMSYYPSKTEIQAIREFAPEIKAKDITAYVYEEFQKVDYRSEEREGLLFVGGFGHGPNVDAVLWFVKEIYPDIYRETKAPFYIVGSKAPDDITNIQQEGVVVKGYVTEEELKELYSTSRIAVVPLRYGAGVKGKVVEALYNNIPLVTTSVGAEGIEGIEDIVTVADEPELISKAIIDLYTNDKKLSDMAARSETFVEEHFSVDAVWNKIKTDFEVDRRKV